MRYLPTPPTEFTSNGASGLISAIYRRLKHKELDWTLCAVVHDWAYYYGGPERLKREADKRLFECVKPYLGTVDAVIIWLGVHIGGAWWLPYRGSRWGYGYPYPHRGQQDGDYVTPPISESAKAARIIDEITGKPAEFWTK